MDELRMGGVTVRCSGGRVDFMETNRPPPKKGRRRKVKKQALVRYSESEGEADSEGELEDYFDNLLAGQDTEDEAETVKALAHFSATELGAGPEVDALRSPGFPDSDSSSLADSEDNTSCCDDVPSISDIIDDFSENVQLESRYPVQTRGQLIPGAFPGVASFTSTSAARRAARQGRKEKASMGENRKLKRQKVQARRAARAAAKGLDLEAVSQQLQDFVVRGTEIEAFPPMSSTSRMYVRKLAGLFGMKSSNQGQGKRAFVLVRLTDRTAVPQGPAREKLDAIIQQYNKANVMVGSSEQVSRAKLPVVGRKRQNMKGGRRKPLEQVAATPSAFQQPVGFIASGCLESPEPQLVMVESVMARRNTMLGASDSKDVAMDAEEDVPVYDRLQVRWTDDCDGDCHMGLGSHPPPVAETMLGSEPPAAGLTLGVFEDRLPRDAEELTLQPMQPDGGRANSESDELQEQIRPSILRTKAQCKAAQKKLQKEGRRAERRENGFSLELPEATFVSTSLAFGEFEKHTRGIGSKLMADMGFKGQGRGLGPLQGGRAEPITASMRRKKLGLGAE